MTCSLLRRVVTAQRADSVKRERRVATEPGDIAMWGDSDVVADGIQPRAVEPGAALSHAETLAIGSLSSGWFGCPRSVLTPDA